MFAYFGNAFVKTLPNAYRSKINGLDIDLESSAIMLVNNNPEAIKQFHHLQELLPRSELMEDNRLDVEEIPEFNIADDYTVLSYYQDVPFEQLFIMDSLDRRIATYRDNDGGNFCLVVYGQTEDKCKQIRDTISEKLEGRVWNNAPRKEFDLWFCDMTIPDGFEFIDGAYRIKDNLKQILIESI